MLRNFGCGCTAVLVQGVRDSLLYIHACGGHAQSLDAHWVFPHRRPMSDDIGTAFVWKVARGQVTPQVIRSAPGVEALADVANDA